MSLVRAGLDPLHVSFSDQSWEAGSEAGPEGTPYLLRGVGPYHGALTGARPS